jgi:hypothetical protein
VSALLAVLLTFIATTSNIEAATGLVIRTGESKPPWACAP